MAGRGETRKQSDALAMQTNGRVTSKQYRKVGGKVVRVRKR